MIHGLEWLESNLIVTKANMLNYPVKKVENIHEQKLEKERK